VRESWHEITMTMALHLYRTALRDVLINADPRGKPKVCDKTWQDQDPCVLVNWATRNQQRVMGILHFKKKYCPSISHLFFYTNKVPGVMVGPFIKNRMSYK